MTRTGCRLTKSVGIKFFPLGLVLIWLVASPLIVLAAGKVNINTAGAGELDNVPEVGAAIAARIIAYREANGPFTKIEDIMKVSGIKDATFAKMRDFITVDGSGEVADQNNEAVVTSTTTARTTNRNRSALSEAAASGGFRVTIGDERLAMVGAPVAFRAAASGGAGNGRILYRWNFGDGATVRGERATHVYRYPGVYQVVLAAESAAAAEAAMARTVVEVIQPEVALGRFSLTPNRSFAELINHSSTEVNLAGWRLAAGHLIFVLPENTLLAAGQTTTIVLPWRQTPAGPLQLWPPGDAVKPMAVASAAVAAPRPAVAEIRSAVAAFRLLVDNYLKARTGRVN